VAATGPAVPFNFSVIAPNITPLANGFSLQARATDSAGFSSLSDLLNVDLLEDVTPPTIVSFVPASNSSQVQLLHGVQVRFSEPMAAAAITTDTVRVTDAAGKGVVPTDFELGDDDKLVQLRLGSLPVGGYRIVVSGAVTDRAGNALGAADVGST